MNRFLKGLVGATALLGAAVSTASAQDYTWTLQMNFSYPGTTVGGSWVTDFSDYEPFDATATGTITFTKVSPGVYELKAYNIVTTTGDLLFGNNPTGFAAVYDSSLFDPVDLPAYSFSISSWNAGGDFYNLDGDYRLSLAWVAGTLFSSMDNDSMDTHSLPPWSSYEVSEPELTNGQRRRLGGTCAFYDEDCDVSEFDSGRISLTSITNVPEPASMALFGAGLLGLYAARRRRVAA